MYKVRRKKIGNPVLLDILARAAGQLYSNTVKSFWRTVRRKGIWLKPSSMMRWLNSKTLHAHSADAVVQSFYSAMSSFRVRRTSDPSAKPPSRLRTFYKVQWKKSAIRLVNKILILSNGRGNEPLMVPWQWGLPVLIEIGFDGKEYELRATYSINTQLKPKGDKVAAVDLGEVHSMVGYDGEKVIIMNGRELRSKKRQRNKIIGAFSSLISRTKKGSRRRKKLLKAKRGQLETLDNQINDITHKQTSFLVSMLYSVGVQTLVIGDIRDIRLNNDLGHKVNQKIHQMSHGSIRHKLSYKAENCGIRNVLINEAYTSQECPLCQKRNKTRSRNYSCSCGFRYHRDGVGAINILKKYRGEGHVVGAMVSPVSMRYSSHMRCSLQQ